MDGGFKDTTSSQPDQVNKKNSGKGGPLGDQISSFPDPIGSKLNDLNSDQQIDTLLSFFDDITAKENNLGPQTQKSDVFHGKNTQSEATQKTVAERMEDLVSSLSNQADVVRRDKKIPADQLRKLEVGEQYMLQFYGLGGSDAMRVLGARQIADRLMLDFNENFQSAGDAAQIQALDVVVSDRLCDKVATRWAPGVDKTSAHFQVKKRDAKAALLGVAQDPNRHVAVWAQSHSR